MTIPPWGLPGACGPRHSLRPWGGKGSGRGGRRQATAARSAMAGCVARGGDWAGVERPSPGGGGALYADERGGQGAGVGRAGPYSAILVQSVLGSSVTRRSHPEVAMIGASRQT